MSAKQDQINKAREDAADAYNEAERIYKKARANYDEALLAWNRAKIAFHDTKLALDKEEAEYKNSPEAQEEENKLMAIFFGPNTHPGACNP